MTESGAAGAGTGGEEWASLVVANTSGSIRVRATNQGLPLALKVESAELHRDPQQLAGEVLRLCQKAANRAGLALRKQLEEAGVPAEAIARAKLPTEADVARQEIVEEQDYDHEPQSWLRSV